MRLVIKHSVTDNCTYWCERVVPVNYESAEAFMVDFEEACQNNINAPDFKFASETWDSYHFFENGKYYGPEILTVDEWFKDTK